MRASSVSAPTRSARIDQGAIAVHGRARDLARCGLGDRDGFAGDHRFVDATLALEHRAVHRHLLARLHPQPIADDHAFERHLLLDPVVAQAPGEIGREFQQLPDGLAGLSHRAELQHVAQDHQRHDHRGRLEIGPDRAVVLAKVRRKQVGQEYGGEAEDVGERHAEADQRVHVQRAMREGEPELAKDRPSDPEHDRRAEHQLDPSAWPRLEAERVMDADHRRHRKDDERDRQRDADPQPAREIAQLRVVRFRRTGDRNERHAAFGAAAGLRTANLRMHGARVFGGGWRNRGQRHQRHAAFRTVARRVPYDLRVHRAGVAPAAGFRRRSRGGRARVPVIVSVHLLRAVRVCLHVGPFVRPWAGRGSRGARAPNSTGSSARTAATIAAGRMIHWSSGESPMPRIRGMLAE